MADLTLELTQHQGVVLHNILVQIAPREAAGKVAVGQVQEKLEAVLQSPEHPQLVSEEKDVSTEPER